MQKNGIIDVLNFKDCEIVAYSIILIKGVIDYDLEENILNCSCDGTSVDWPVLNNYFRCLVALKKGSNEIILTHPKCQKKVLTIQYVPRKSIFYVIPIYFVFKNHSGEYECSSDLDRSPEKASTKIGFCSKLVQSLYAEKLYEHGFGHKTFQLESDISKDAPVCRVFHSKHSIEEIREKNAESLWEILGREIISSGFNSTHCKYLGVTSSTCSGVNGIKGDVALGSGGLALIGSLTLCTWPEDVDQVVPCFSDPSSVHYPLSDNLWYKGSKGGCCSASIGSLCHELGHTFDLAHPSTGIMSTDFHLVHSVFLPVQTSDQSKLRTFNLEFENSLVTDLNNVKVTNLKPSLNGSNGENKKCGMKNFPSFSKGCATILSHHKWFNDSEVASSIYFEPDRRLLKSEVGLKVVQLRGECGRVLKSWEFSGDRKQHMVLPNLSPSVTIFTLDKYGNIARFSPSQIT